jgi:hypothetical protein
MPIKKTLIPTGQKAVWVPEPVSTFVKKRKCLASVWNQTPILEAGIGHFIEL